MNWGSWAVTINAAARHLYKLSRRRFSVLALVAVAACGASDGSSPSPAPNEQVGESRAALSAVPTNPVTDDFSSGVLGAGWPSQWSTAPGSNATAIVSTAPFSTTGLLGRMGGLAGNGSIKYLQSPAKAVNSDQSISIAIGSGTGVEYPGLVTRLSALATAPNNPSFASYYGILVTDVAGGRLRFYKTVNGTYAQVGPLAAATPPAGVSIMTADSWYRLRFKVTQVNAGYTLLQAKMWQGVEPAGWTLELFDNEPTLAGVSGYSGIAGSIGSSNNRFLYFDDYRLEGAQPPDTCTIDSDCVAGRYCSQSGECRVYGATCSGNAMCGSGQSCQDSQCVCPSPPVGACNANGGPAPTLSDLLSGFPNLRYRKVTYARDTADYFVLPTLTLPTTALVSPTLQRANHFIFNVPSTRVVALTLNVGNSSLPVNPGVDVIVYTAAGVVAWRGSIDSRYPGQLQSTSTIATLPAGNYEVDVVPRDPALAYTITTSDPAVPLAFKGGADLAQPGAAVFFYVPAEAETAFLLGAFDPAVPVQFFPPETTLGSPDKRLFFPSATPVTASIITPNIYALDTKGKPGVWKAIFRTTTSRAHFLNLPDVFSFEPRSIIASRRIRTDMSSSTGGSPTAVTRRTSNTTTASRSTSRLLVRRHSTLALASRPRRHPPWRSSCSTRMVRT